jgi:hypothetical protein
MHDPPGGRSGPSATRLAMGAWAHGLLRLAEEKGTLAVVVVDDGV